jgi:ABC-type phosphate/phosphonate transport system substrate-binding protein
LELGLSCKTEVESNSFADTLTLLGRESDFDYELLERIGRGGMGVVYRARQRSLNRIVALKMIGMGDFASPATLARFRREAETAAKLDHPNIVAIIEIGEHHANPFLVMRLVEGDSLAGRLDEWALPRQVKAMEASQAQIRIAGLLAKVARAVDYAHRRGVLHRDLKPSNILLDLEGNPHLTDFGLAKSLDQEPGLTQTAELLGTLSYMAPEQAAGKAVSRTADIYSLGVILYELLTGHPPFEGPKMDVLRQVLENAPRQPRLINSLIDRDLATICLKCLDKDRARRYRSALELAEELERWQRHEPILARQAGPIIRLRRWSMRNPAVAILLLTLTVGIAASLALLARANEAKARKSIALDILRTESARQLQELWTSASSFVAIKSETLSAMAGMEVARLTDPEHRFTIALIAEGNPLDRVLKAAPMFDQLERSMSGLGENPTRLDLRLYKDHAHVIEDLVKREVDFAQLNPREFLRARALDPEIQPLITILPTPGFNDAAVIFTRKSTGIKTLPDLRGKSFLLSATDSPLSFWAKVILVDSGIRANDLSRYRYIDRDYDLLPDGGSALAVAVGNPYSSMTPVEAVLANVYDAGVVREKRFREVAVEQGLVALHRFQNAGDLLVARGDLPAEAARTFQRVLVELKDWQSDQTFLDAPARFRAATRNDFKEISSKLEVEAVFEK